MFAREWSHLQEDRISEPSMSDPEEQEDETTPAVFIAKQRELAQKSPALSQAGLDRLESDRGAGHTPLLRFQLMWLALMILAIISGVLVNSGVIRAVHLPRLRSIASAPQPLSSLAEVKREWTDGQWTVTSLDRQLEGVPYVVSVHDWHRSDAVLQARPLLGRCRELSGDRAPLLCVNRGRVASYAYASAPTSVIETPRIINPNQLLESEESLMLTAGTDVLCQQVIIPPPITNFFQSLAENILNPLLHIFSFLQMTHGTFLQVRLGTVDPETSIRWTSTTVNGNPLLLKHVPGHDTTHLTSLTDIFTGSLGLVTPCYPARHLLYWISSEKFWTLLVSLWVLHMVASPPVTLVHVPRLLCHLLIGLYRYLILYLLLGHLESWFQTGFDFSDHIVIFCMAALVMSLEFVAVVRSYRQLKWTLYIDDRKSPSTFDALRLWAFRVVLTVLLAACVSLCVLTFYTAAFFHTVSEVWVGLGVGLLGIFGVFWGLLLGNVFSLEKIGILRLRRI